MIKIIYPYKHNNLWVFDDINEELLKEELTMGMEKIIEHLTYNLSNADHGFKCIFSNEPITDYDAILNHIDGENGGNWYKLKDTNMIGWLCPALYNYFNVAPKKIYLKIKALKKL